MLLTLAQIVFFAAVAVYLFGVYSATKSLSAVIAAVAGAVVSIILLVGLF